MLRSFLVAVLFLFSSAAFAAGGEHADAEKKAVTAAKAWLAMVDNGDYAASWAASATPMKTAVTLEDWDRAMKGVRAPLGAMLVRKLATATYATTLPGAPDGQYVVITFKTRFANKKAAVETVTPMIDTDGTWHVSGYFIR
ncbi:MAG: DUF4019 domain-containing protein [Pseudomonadota bacterium]|nr:DUF4019 domain-containing protein [Pseudomonadota bacterium]